MAGWGAAPEAGAAGTVPGRVWGTGRTPALGFTTGRLPGGLGATGFFATVFFTRAGRATDCLVPDAAEGGSGARIGRPDSR